MYFDAESKRHDLFVFGVEFRAPDEVGTGISVKSYADPWAQVMMSGNPNYSDLIVLAVFRLLWRQA